MKKDGALAAVMHSGDCDEYVIGNRRREICLEYLGHYLTWPGGSVSALFHRYSQAPKLPGDISPAAALVKAREWNADNEWCSGITACSDCYSKKYSGSTE